MSFIQVDKKAITEEEGQALIEQTYGLMCPLGTATMFIQPKDFEPHWLEKLPTILQNPLVGFSNNKDIRDQLTEQTRQFYLDGHLSHLDSEPREEAVRGLHDDIKHNADLVLKSRLTPSEIKHMGALRHLDDYNPPHTIKADAYKPPIRSVIMLPFEQVNGDVLHRRLLRQDETDVTPTRPGMNEQYHFNALWHEIGHGTGAEEPQTETIAAIVTRKAFEDSTCLSAFADLRAHRAVLRHDNIDKDSHIMVPEREVYGWPMVEVNDYIQGLPQETIDAMSEEDLINIRHQPFAHLGNSVRMVAALLRDNFEEAWVTGDLKQLGTAAGEIKNSPFLKDDEKQIAARFQLACERLYYGALAYEEGNDFIDDELLESERKQPLTFKPGEFIPE